MHLIRAEREAGDPPRILVAPVERKEGRMVITGTKHDVSESFYAALLGFVNDWTERGLVKLTADGREEILQLCESASREKAGTAN